MVELFVVRDLLGTPKPIWPRSDVSPRPNSPRWPRLNEPQGPNPRVWIFTTSTIAASVAHAKEECPRRPAPIRARTPSDRTQGLVSRFREGLNL